MLNRNHFRFTRWAAIGLDALISMLLIAAPVLADDVEIYLTAPSDAVNPNVLFVLDESGSMAWGVSSGDHCGDNCRIDQLQEALTTILDSSSMENINAAVMGFSTNFSGSATRAACGTETQEHQCGTEQTQSCTTQTETYQCDTNLVEQCEPATCEPVCAEPVCREECERVCKKWKRGRCRRWRKTCEQVCDEPVCTDEVVCTEEVCQTVEEPVYCERDVETCETVETPVMCTEEVDVCNTEPVSVSGKTSLVYSDFVQVSDTSRAALLTVVDDLRTYLYTPTVQALRDAVDWFDGSLTDLTGTTYSSPIQLWCQPNHIVLMSDGRPNYNEPTASHGGLTSYDGSSCAWSDANIGDGGSSLGYSSYTVDGHWVSGDSPQDGRCAPEIANWAYTTDLKNGANWEGDQNIVTHTIGFYTDEQAETFLSNVATNGGGNFYTADNAAELVNAFESILVEAGETIEYAYTTPVIPMDASNAIVSGDKIYVPLMQPNTKAFWKGNLKKYTIEIDANNDVVLKGANDHSVLDDNYMFLNSAHSLWSTGADGADPLAGGAASKLTGTRNLYTYQPNSNSTLLTAADNALAVDNAEITAAMFGLDANDTGGRAELLNWIKTGRGEMGAPLHTGATIVTYSGGEQLALLPTSEGVLHAIDTDDGTEVWAFMPDELLDELPAIKANADNVGPPIYGLDGPGIVIHNDDGAAEGHAGNGLIDTDESAYYVVGMRRGGRNYYALDISSRIAPEFAWEIIGGSGDFAALGQTWSKPQMGKLLISDTPTDVLIFGGGYDADQDAVTGARTADDIGNAIYIVNAATGARLKWISDSGADLNIAAMTNSIPADPVVVDIDADGLSDRIYAADVGGRILRIDLGNTLTGGVIADINGGDAAGNRRFFNAPDVAYVSLGGDRYLAVVIGSGFIPEPGDTTVQDRFYMIKDHDVFDVPTDENDNVVYTTLIESDLYNATANLIQDAATEEERTAAIQALAGKVGWYIDMAENEKVFSQAGVYDYIVLFSTFAVTDGAGAQSENACEVSSIDGEGAIYAVYLLDATALFASMDGNVDLLNATDRSHTLSVPGLPPKPVVLYPNEDGGTLSSAVVAIGGLERIVTWSDRFRALYWEEARE